MKIRFAFSLFGIVGVTILHAEVTLPPVLGDNAVLQHGTAVPVWGTAAPTEKITVTITTKSKKPPRFRYPKS